MKTVEPIPVMRAAYLNLFMDALKASGRYDENHLQQFNLPSTLADRPDLYIPLNAALSFMHCETSNTGITDLGQRAASRLKVSDFDTELRDALSHTHSLQTALQTFCELAEHEQSPARYWIGREQNEIRVSSTLDAYPYYKLDQCGEWFQIMSLITIIREYAGDDWEPMTINFRAGHGPGEHVRQIFPNTRFNTGKAETSITFPASLFKLANTEYYKPNKTEAMPAHKTAESNKIAVDFPASLRLIIQAYLENGYPDIKLAAKISGCSVRTLQRRLERFGLSYTDIIQQARFEIATNLLKEPGMKVIDAAYSAGYEDPSHFSRAFRRLLGVSPHQYRTHNYAC